MKIMSATKQIIMFLVTIASAIAGSYMIYTGLHRDIALGTAVGVFVIVMSIFAYIELSTISLRDEILNNVGKRVIHEMVKDPEVNDEQHG